MSDLFHSSGTVPAIIISLNRIVIALTKVRAFCFICSFVIPSFPEALLGFRLLTFKLISDGRIT